MFILSFKFEFKKAQMTAKTNKMKSGHQTENFANKYIPTSHRNNTPEKPPGASAEGAKFPQ